MPENNPHTTGVNLCTCFPHTYAKATPVLHVSEIEVIDPYCLHHGEKK